MPEAHADNDGCSSRACFLGACGGEAPTPPLHYSPGPKNERTSGEQKAVANENKRGTHYFQQTGAPPGIVP